MSILSCSGSNLVVPNVSFFFASPPPLPARSVSVRAACWPVVVHQLHQDIQHRKDTIKLQDHFGTARTWSFFPKKKQTLGGETMTKKFAKEKYKVRWLEVKGQLGNSELSKIEKKIWSNYRSLLSDKRVV